ncbi:plasmid recombination protein [Staphylococcus epidermidis]|nr:plasmid recombination protein [Staphylococcus epidermidis]
MSAKEVLGNKKALTEFQDRFNEHINSCGYDLSRGITRGVTPRRHEQISRYKNLTDYHKEEYEHESRKLDRIKQESEEVMEQYQNALDVLKKPINVPYELEIEKKLVDCSTKKHRKQVTSLLIKMNLIYCRNK